MRTRLARLSLGFALSATSVVAAPREKFAAQTEARIDGRIYSQPNRYGKPISIVGRGLDLKVLRYSSTRTWALVETPSKRRGWIPVRATTLGIRYSADSLARSAKGATAPSSAGKNRGPASRGPASDNIDLDDLGYDGSQYEDDAQALAENALQEAETQAGDVPSYSGAPGADQINGAISDAEVAAAGGSDSAPPADEYIDSAQGDDSAASEDDAATQSALLQELNSVDPNTGATRKPLRGVRIKDPSARKNAKARTTTAESDFNFVFGLEYANQINVGQASGFGLNLAGSYNLSSEFSVGLAVNWDRFVDQAQTSQALVRRQIGVLRIGPIATLKIDNFGLDLMAGLSRSSTSFSITDNQGVPTAPPPNLALAGTETAFGLRISPHVNISVTDTMAVRGYFAYAIDFNGVGKTGDSGVPQTISFGAALALGF